MRTALSVGLLLPAVLLGSGVLGAEPPKADDAEQAIVLLAPGRPLLLRLRLRLDGEPFRAAERTASEAYLTALFRHLDANDDGSLSDAEARRMPSPVRLSGDPSRPATRVAFNYRVLDADSDGRVSAAELAAFHREYSGGTVFIRTMGRVGVPSGVNDRLFTRLDANRDGKLTAAELGNTAAVFDLDLDRNELLEPREFLPNVAAAGGPLGAGFPAAPAAAAGGSAGFAVSSADDRTALASALLARYGFGPPWLLRESLGLAPVAFDRMDANRDGSLDVKELERFIDREPDLELVVRLGRRGDGEPAVEMLGTAAVSRAADGTLSLPAGAARLEVRANDVGPAPGKRARDGILELFRSAADRKGFLTAADAVRTSFFPNLFVQLDRNRDDRLTEGELRAYLADVQPRQEALLATTPVLLVSGPAGGLFELLDRDQDGRLSLREVREAPRLPALLGLGKDEAIMRADLRPCYRVAIGAGRATLNRSGAGGFTLRTLPMLTLSEAAPSGLVWFQKMDRNRDGDVSPTEFLGPADAFARIDADGDGLLSREEAERADSRFRRTP